MSTLICSVQWKKEYDICSSKKKKTARSTGPPFCDIVFGFNALLEQSRAL
jgi:hypothetical protein